MKKRWEVVSRSYQPCILSFSLGLRSEQDSLFVLSVTFTFCLLFYDVLEHLHFSRSFIPVLDDYDFYHYATHRGDLSTDDNNVVVFQ